jgi:FtsP/CotA-like multicopper oxidase with cupredoxin domain
VGIVDMNMKMKKIKQGVVLATLLMAAGQAGAATFNLCAGTMTKTMPDSTVITMWGYGLDTGVPCVPTVPGPRLTVPPGDNTLTVNLRNELAGPVSIVVPGQQATMAPVFFTDGQGRSRVRSFDKETASAATASYSWTGLKPGTFLYHSGTHPAVQVQMGLYGSVTHDAAAGEAYAGIPYDNEVMLYYSEIDPALHAAVDGGIYGTPAYPSTINYVPKYFPAGAVGGRTLIRFLNAGLEDHVPVLQGSHMSMVAEDGNPYPYAREQYSLLLAALKTRDGIFAPAADGEYAVYDRRLRLTNNLQGGGGMMSFLSVSAAGGGSAPLAVDDTATTPEETATTIDVADNDTDPDGLDLTTVVVSQPVNGLAASNGGGMVTYTPNTNYNGSDNFTYTIRDNGGNISNVATVNVTVSAANDNPLATDDSYSTPDGTALNVAAPGVLGNDNDVDGDALTADSFTYSASDGGGVPSIATVTITVTPVVNQPPDAVDDYDTVTRNTGATANSVTVNVLSNDTDDGTIDATSVAITTAPRKGAVVNNGGGSITYTPQAGKRGSDAFGYTVNDDQGVTSNEATVRIDIVK